MESGDEEYEECTSTDESTSSKLSTSGAYSRPEGSSSESGGRGSGDGGRPSRRALPWELQLRSLCSLLRRSLHVTSLTLVFPEPDLPVHGSSQEAEVSSKAKEVEEEDGIQCYWELQDSALAEVLQRVGQAAGARLQRLSIKPGCGTWGSQWHYLSCVSEFLAALGAHFPALTHFSLGFMVRVEELGEGAPGLAHLPPSVHSLSLSLRTVEQREHDIDLAHARLPLRALPLPAMASPHSMLRSVQLHASNFALDVSPLALQARAASALVQPEGRALGATVGQAVPASEAADGDAVQRQQQSPPATPLQHQVASGDGFQGLQGVATPQAPAPPARATSAAQACTSAATISPASLHGTSNSTSSSPTHALCQSPAEPAPQLLQHLALGCALHRGSLAAALAVPGLGHSMQSLSLNTTQLDSNYLTGLLRCLPNLGVLSMGQAATKPACTSPSMHLALCSLTKLTCIRGSCAMVAELLSQQPGGPCAVLPPFPASLELVQLDNPGVLVQQPGLLSRLLTQGWLPGACRVSLVMHVGCSLALQDAEAALAHPGGVGAWLVEEDRGTQGGEVGLYLPGCISLCPAVLQQLLLQPGGRGGGGLASGGLAFADAVAAWEAEVPASVAAVEAAGAAGEASIGGSGGSSSAAAGFIRRSGVLAYALRPRPSPELPLRPLRAVYLSLMSLDFQDPLAEMLAEEEKQEGEGGGHGEDEVVSGSRQEDVQEALLEALRPGSPIVTALSGLQALAFGLGWKDPRPVLGSVKRLLEAGQLPALKQLVLHDTSFDPCKVLTWARALTGVLRAGHAQGLTVQLVLRHWRPDCAQALEQLAACTRRGLPDPDALKICAKEVLWDYQG